MRLCASEVITLAIFARWSRFASERDFYRYAQSTASARFSDSARPLAVQSLVALLHGTHRGFRLASDGSSADAESALTKRWIARLRLPGIASVVGMDGWPGRLTSVGNSLGWYEGFSLLTAIDPTGIITGYLLRKCFDLRPASGGNLLRREGLPKPEAIEREIDLRGPYIADKGFEAAPRTTAAGNRATGHPSSIHLNATAASLGLKRLRRWAAAIRQIVESVYDKLFNIFGLWRERPHELQRIASSFGGEGSSAQFLHLAQRSTRSSQTGLR